MINLSLSKRTVVIIIGIALVFCVAVFIKINTDVGSLNDAAKASVVAAKQSTKQQIDALNAGLASSELSRSVKNEKLAEFISYLQDSIDDTCKDQTSSLYAVLSEEVSHCEEKVKTLAKAKLSAEKVTELINFEAKIASHIPTRSQTASYKTVYENWKSAGDSAEELEVSNDFRDIKDKLVFTLKNHASAWGRLVDANTNRNAKEFDLASDEIENTYVRLTEAVSDIKALLSEYLSAFSADLSLFYGQ